MKHPFEILRPEYEADLRIMRVVRQDPVERAVERIRERGLDDYRAVGASTGVPAAWLASTDYRESDCNPRDGLGQGDPWNRVSTHVPRGHGPFRSWAEAAIFYVGYDHVNEISAPWSWAYASWKWEAWNGFGPRDVHRRRSGYLDSCTSLYDPPSGAGGKYVADGVWNGDEVDPQAGVIPVAIALCRAVPDLLFAPLPELAEDALPSDPQPAPVGVHNALALQQALNHMGAVPALLEDGNYGRLTRRAVRVFQAAHGLTADGLAGVETWSCIEGLIRETATGGVES